MFAGQYHCKLDEKGRFILPTPLRELMEAQEEPAGETKSARVMFVKGQDLPLSAYSSPAWNTVLARAKNTFTEDQNRLFMHYVVAEAASSEIDKAGRILVPGRLRKLIPVEEDLEIVLVGMYHRLEIWNPSAWRRYLMQHSGELEEQAGKMLDLL